MPQAPSTSAPPAPIRDRILASARTLVLERGFASTTVDAVLTEAGASKGAFFHHFPSKGALGRAIVDAYVRDDAAFLDDLLERAAAATDDPGEQLLYAVRRLEAMADAPLEEQPACLMVSFIYENQLGEAGIGEIVRGSIRYWRERIRERLEAAARTRTGLQNEDLDALADHVFVTIEGAFLLTRAMDDATALRRQLGQLRRYLEVLLDGPP